MKNLHKLLVFVCIFVGINVSFAQDSLRQRHLIFKVTPLTIVDIDNTFQVAVEHSLTKSKHWSLTEEFGYGKANANFWGNIYDYSSFRENFRVRLEARKYQKTAPDLTGRYFAYELFYKQVNDRMNRSVGRECESGPCNYYEKLDYSVSKYVVGGTGKIGYQIRLKDEDKKKTNFIFDFYAGLGLRRIMIDHRVDGTIQNNFFFFGGNDSLFANDGLGYKDKAYNIPHLAFGIKFGYFIF